MFLAALLLAPLVPQQQCAAIDANLPPPMASWKQPGDTLGPGKSMVLVTGTPDGLEGLVRTDKPGRATVMAFMVEKPGRYGIALDQPGWIDVYRYGAVEPLVSAKHGHGPECSSIRKIVYFELAPGPYKVTIVGLESLHAKVMVVDGE